MEFSTKTGNSETLKTACLVVGVFESRKLADAARAIDRASNGRLAAALQRGDMEGRSGTSLLLHDLPGVRAERVLLAGLGKEDDFNEKAYRDAVVNTVAALKSTGARDAVLDFPRIKDRPLEWHVETAVRLVEDSLYRFVRMKSKPGADAKPALKRVAFGGLGGGEVAIAGEAIHVGRAVANGMALTRDLGNLPGNVCTPSYLAAEARSLGKASGIKVQVLEEKDMQHLGMGALLSVAKGSRQPPKLIVLEYHGAAKGTKPVALVGKGITFDAGGISLKPAAEMDEMKFDMCGAASVLGTLKAIAELNLPVNVVGVIPTCYNMPDGAANKPGDIVTSMSGQTIEVLNTDAEGRLILCDALTYTERFEPEAVVDIATLTGACVIALGHVATGLLANDDGLAGQILSAGDEASDRIWRLPLWDDYQEQLDSNFADMANIGGRPGGTITAACFLSRFAKKFRWAHLDIAGTAWRSGKQKGATGRPVPLLVHFLMARAEGHKV